MTPREKILREGLTRVTYANTRQEAWQIASETLARADAVAETDGWIAVGDRLPEEEQFVLAYRPFAHLKPAADRNVRCLMFRGLDVPFSIGGFDGTHEVTHWQPLPQPPKTKD